MDHGDVTAIRQAVESQMRGGDPSHDMSHLDRVAQQCRILGRAEGGDERIVLAAAYLHDLVNLPKDHPDRQHASRASADAAVGILTRLAYSDAEIGRVCRAIEEHSFSRGLACSSIESMVLQDADRLDALGAIGVLRAATCGAFMGARYYDPDDVFAQRRPLADKHYLLDHFPAKLLRLAASFNTVSGRREAERRTRFMRAFVGQLHEEIGAGRGAAGTDLHAPWSPDGG